MTKDTPPDSGTRMHKISIGANLPSLLFAIGGIVFLPIGVPSVRTFLLMSLVAGSVAAVVLRRSGISMNRIRGGAGLPSLFLMVGSAAFLLTCIPALRIFLSVSLVVAGVIAVVIHRKSRVNRYLEDAFLAGHEGRSGTRLE
jgi:hypothetical protein